MPYIDAAGLHTYYREAGRPRGEAPTVALLHGGLMGGSSWEAALPALVDDFRLLIPDRRGHGRTPDVDGPYTYPAMGTETIAFLEQLGDSPTHLIGYSDGGIVALQVAIERPDLVASAVLVGTNFHVDGLIPGLAEQIAHTDPDGAELAMFRDPYGDENPDGKAHFAVMAAKAFEMGSTGPTLTRADLGRVGCPVLVLNGDADTVRPEHTLAMVASIPVCRQSVIPGVGHSLAVAEPELMMAIVRRFLDDVLADAVTPIQRGW